MKTNLLPALKLTFFSFVVCAILYPFAVWAIAQWSPNQGKGFLIESNGRVFYKNIGQLFTEEGYFQSRPSAVDYNAAGSGGSNLAGSNREYLLTVQQRIQAFQQANPTVSRAELPVELVTASGSGLDPDLTVQGARVQVARIAKVRALEAEKVQELVTSHIEKPLLGIFGPEKVNVLMLNLALDKLSAERSKADVN